MITNRESVSILFTDEMPTKLLGNRARRPVCLGYPSAVPNHNGVQRLKDAKQSLMLRGVNRPVDNHRDDEIWRRQRTGAALVFVITGFRSNIHKTICYTFTVFPVAADLSAAKMISCVLIASARLVSGMGLFFASASKKAAN